MLQAHKTGLARDSVANVTQIFSVDRGLLDEPVGQITSSELGRIFAGIDTVLGR